MILCVIVFKSSILFVQNNENGILFYCEYRQKFFGVFLSNRLFKKNFLRKLKFKFKWDYEFLGK